MKFSSIVTRWLGIFRPMWQRSHLLIVVKSAATATGAWLVGVTLPGEMPDYAYYAPLGALVAMAPTVASSVMSSIKSVLGVVLGLGVAWALIFTGIHGVMALFLAIAISTLISGISWLGPGKTYIPFAAAFVFLTGRSDPEEFSLGLTVQFALGAGLGVIANVIFPPALHVQSTRQRVIDLREAVVECLATVSKFLDSGVHDPPNSSLQNRLDQATDTAYEAERYLSYSSRNLRGNVRTTMVNTDLSMEHRELVALRTIIHELYPVLDVPPELRGDDETEQEDPAVPEHIGAAISEACDLITALLHSDTLSERDDDTDHVTPTFEALSRAHAATMHWETSSDPTREWVYSTIHALRRVGRQLA